MDAEETREDSGIRCHARAVCVHRGRAFTVTLGWESKQAQRVGLVFPRETSKINDSQEEMLGRLELFQG